MLTGRFLAAVGLLVCLAVVHVSFAQDDDGCSTIVMQALETVDSDCEGIGRNQACYGNPLIDVAFQHDVEATFAQPGDLTALTGIDWLHTMPLDMQTGDWGIALMKVQANLPDTMPGQNVTFLLTGDVTLTDVSAEMGAAPMQAFYFTTGIGETTCQNAPNSLVIQSPQGTRVTLTVNGTDISLGSTAVLEITPAGNMDVLLVGGVGEVTAAGMTESVPAGEMTTVTLGDDGLAATAPTTAMTFDATRIQYVPFKLLPEIIKISVTERWTDTGIMLQAGDRFTIGASGWMNTHISKDDPHADFNLWTPPAGFPTDDACPVTSLENYSCRYTCEEGIEGCPEGAPIMALIGRVGTRETFLVGAGGTYVADADGMLQLGIYEGAPVGYEDNAGAFYAIVTVMSGADGS